MNKRNKMKQRVLPRYVKEEINRLLRLKKKFSRDKKIESSIEYKIELTMMYAVINAAQYDGAIRKAVADDLRNEFYWSEIDSDLFRIYA